MDYIREFNSYLEKKDYYNALKIIREADEEAREKILSHIGVDGIYSLFVNALVNNHADLTTLLDIVKSLGKQYYEPIHIDLEKIIKTYIGSLLEENNYEQLRRLANELKELPSEEYSWKNKLYAWASLLSNPIASQLWSQLQDSIDNKRWVDAVMLYDKIRESDILPLIDNMLRNENIDPKSFWKEIIFNAVVESVNKGDLEKGRSILTKYGSILGGEAWERLAGYVYINLAHSCGEKGDIECIARVLDKTPDKYKSAVALSWIMPIIKSPDKYTKDVLEKARELAREYGYEELYNHIDLILNSGKYSESFLRGFEKVLNKLGEEVSKEVMDTIESGDPEKIKDLLSKYANLFRSIVLKDNITLYDYIESIAWFIENQRKLRETFDRIYEVEDTINTYIKKKEKKPGARLGVSSSEIEGIRNTLLDLINTREFQTLLHLGILGEDVDKAVRKSIGFLYFAEALATLDQGDSEKAKMLISEASKYNPEYETIYYYIELMGTKLTRDDIECILENEDIIKPVKIKGEEPKAPTYRSAILPSPSRSFHEAPLSPRSFPQRGGGVNKHVPI